MNYIVTYDIPSDHNYIRKKVSDCCLDFGLLRLQLSVFWGTLSRNEVRDLAFKCMEVLDNIPVDLRFIAVCDECFKSSFAILNHGEAQTGGVVKLNEDSRYSIASHTYGGWEPRNSSSP